MGFLYDFFCWLVNLIKAAFTDSVVSEFLLDYGDMIIIAVVVTLAVYGCYRRITRKRGSATVAREEKIEQKPSERELIPIPEGMKTYDLLISPKHFNEVKNLLVSKDVKPAMHIDKDGIHFVFETEKKWHCDVMVEAGMLLDYKVTAEEEPFINESFPTLPTTPVVTSETKSDDEVLRATEKKKRKTSGSKIVVIKFTEIFPPEWTDEDIKKQISYHHKEFLASLKGVSVEVQEGENPSS